MENKFIMLFDLLVDECIKSMDAAKVFKHIEWCNKNGWVAKPNPYALAA